MTVSPTSFKNRSVFPRHSSVSPTRPPSKSHDPQQKKKGGGRVTRQISGFCFPVGDFVVTVAECNLSLGLYLPCVRQCEETSATVCKDLISLRIFLRLRYHDPSDFEASSSFEIFRILPSVLFFLVRDLDRRTVPDIVHISICRQFCVCEFCGLFLLLKNGLREGGGTVPRGFVL